MVSQIEFILPPYKRGFHLITHIIESKLGELPEKGLLNILIKHTSAAITINENADPSVRADFESFFNKLVPENQNFYSHNSEGSDDITAHLKASIIGQSLTIPITNHRINLGAWQGIYLCEFRVYGGHRKLVLTVYY
ncbi:MAG: YjbQ family protein [Bacteroidia bacterium]|nr:YjbQ family protein [Bacteroidia bacterium]